MRGFARIALCLLPLCLNADEVWNPTRHRLSAEALRLSPPASGPIQVLRDGKPVPAQREESTGELWICDDYEPGETVHYELRPGSAALPNPFTVQEQDGQWLLSNGSLALRVPASRSGGTAPAPLMGWHVGQGAWRGTGQGATPGNFLGLETRILGRGPVYAEAELHYRYSGGEQTVRIRLPAHRPYAWIHERHQLETPSAWELDLSAGWAPREGILRRWHSGPFKGAPSQETLPIAPGYTRLGETLAFLQPRWTQSYDEGYFFGISDGQELAAALVLRAGLWQWPHDNLIEARLPRQGQASLRLPLHRGARTWLFLAGPADLSQQVPDILRREAVLPLDKLLHDYKLPPAKPGEKLLSGVDFFSSSTNPTGMMRQQARNALRDIGKPMSGLQASYAVQAVFDPDWYGDMRQGWSPINPNFHTDFIKGGIANACRLRDDPTFPHIRALAEAALRKDIEFAVTLPGGAGQECPGYFHHAMETWRALAPHCANYLGFDPRTWPRYQAAGAFIARSSQPDGNARRFHPGGDTHPGRPDPLEVARLFGDKPNPQSWVSEELPGFGAILRNHSGSPRETYVAFKAGSNRGHYHGDQLSFHLCANAKPLAVDHHCSYKPRAGQEHMHNRLSFSVPGFPWANMDGHERLIGFATSPVADAAIGQVESRRLRAVTPLPPEEWDTDQPQHAFDTPLVYRRSLVLLKDPDLLVIRDAFQGPEVTATFNLHVLGQRCERDGNRVRFDGLDLVMDAIPTFDTLPWEHENGGLERTIAARVSRSGRQGVFLSLLSLSSRPPDVRALPDGFQVGDDTVRFSEQGGVEVVRQGRTVLKLADEDIDLNRSQGDIGLFVPDVGYPFGPLPDWLLKQRARLP